MNASIFGGGIKDNTTKEYLDSVEIGKILAEHGYAVHSGGYYGIMEAVSKGYSQIGGESIGYTCKTFPSTKGNKYLTQTVVTNDIFDRLRYLMSDVDIFIVQRGSVGTLSELFLAIDIVRKLKDKPTILLIGSFWRDIINSISLIVSKDEIELLTVIDDYKDIIKYLK